MNKNKLISNILVLSILGNAIYYNITRMQPATISKPYELTYQDEEVDNKKSPFGKSLTRKKTGINKSLL